MVALVGRARRARRHAQTGGGGLSETALPYPLEPPLLGTAFHKYGNVNAGSVTRPTTL